MLTVDGSRYARTRHNNFNHFATLCSGGFERHCGVWRGNRGREIGKLQYCYRTGSLSDASVCLQTAQTISSPQWGAGRSCRFIALDLTLGRSALVVGPSPCFQGAWLLIVHFWLAPSSRSFLKPSRLPLPATLWCLWF